MMYRGLGTGRDDGRNRGQIGRSPPRRRRSPEGDNKFCIYCKIQVSSARLYEEHKSSAVHKQKEILIGKALSDGLQYCYTCEKIFPSKLALDAHCLMTRHKPLYRVDELQELIGQSVNTSNHMPMEHLPLNPESRRAREEKERQDIVSKLNEVVRGNTDSVDKNIRCNEGSDIKNVIGNDKHVEVKDYFCEVCNVDCMNYSNYKIHTESWRHRSEVDKKRDEEMKVENQKKFEKEAEHQFEAEEVERKKVPEHLTGNAGYFCEVCSIASVSEAAYLDHLRNRKHFRQVGQMRRPYKCYFCDVEFNVGKDFNYHLESRTHMDTAFNKEDKSKKQEKDDEWVEKKTDRRENRNKDERKDDRSRRTWHNEKKEHWESRSNEGQKDIRKTEMKETASKHTDGRKVEIVDSPADTGIKDLREKLKAQKIIITKSNSPEKLVDENRSEEIHQTEEVQENRSQLEEFEKEFEAKFDALIKEYENDNAGLQGQLARDREEDINAYQRYEDDFKELNEEEEFIRGNIDNLEDQDPCKEDFIIDIIRVQRKMEEVRQQLEIKEMTIIKREILYRKYFPEIDENQESASAESKNSTYVYDYNHGNADKEVNVVQNVVEGIVSPDNAAEISSTDLRIKLERERLMKRLGPELESVDPSLREKLLSVIFEKERDSEKPSKEGKGGDTRQVVKDDDSRKRHTQMEILTKREKQLEIELANLKSNSSDKKKNVTKSLVPQYDDVDDKKKGTKKRSRKRSVSPSSASSRSSSSSSSGSSYYRKRKRRSSPLKSRPKSKRSVSTEKSRRKRRRSISREREKKKRVAAKRDKVDEKKKRIEHLKNEKKKTVKVTMKSQDKGNKVVKSNKPAHVDNDSDVQEINLHKVQPISVIGSASVITPINMPTILEVQSTMPAQPTGTSNLPSQRKEQFSFWKNQVVQPSTKDSPKEDIWDSAFCGGQKEDTTGSATLNLFDPTSGAQLPEDILNILKSVAPIIQQNQHQSSLKQRMSTTSNSINNSNHHLRGPSNNDNVINRDGKDDNTRIRSILKKGIDQLPPQSVHEDPVIIDHPHTEIPGLESSSLDYPSSSVPRRIDNAGRSILKSQSAFKDHHHTEASKSLYNDNSLYSSADENARCELNDHPPVQDDFTHKQHSKSDKVHDASNTKPYERDTHYDKRNVDADTKRRNKEWSDSSRSRMNITNQSNTLSEASQLPEDKETKRQTYETVIDYRMQVPPPGAERHDTYNDIDKYRQPNIPIERDRPDHTLSPRIESTSTTGGPSGWPTAEKIDTYDSERNLIRQDRDPYLRSEVTHRVIDYSYVRDTRVISGDSTAASTIYNDTTMRQPVRYPGETDDEYYARFERFYEVNRRNEEQSGIPRRLDGGRINPDGRAPPREEFYAQNERKERYDDRLPRTPHTENYARPRGVADHDRNTPLSRVEESVRRVERIPYQDEGRDAGRDAGNRAPYQVVEITKRVEDKSVIETNTSSDRHLPYHWSEMVDTGRNPRNDVHLPIRDNNRGMRNTLPRLPPPHLPQPLLSMPAQVAGDYDNKFQDY